MNHQKVASSSSFFVPRHLDRPSIHFICTENAQWNDANDDLIATY